MKITPFFNLVENGNEASLEITGDIGYNSWADTYDEYKKNTSENIAKELNALTSLKSEVINVTISSLGGDLMHALDIYSLLRNSGAKVKTYLRGANASSATIIASAASSVNDIYMDVTGVYLIHKPMTYVEGNANDMQEGINSLNKFQQAIEQAYLNLGVSQELLNDLMEGNNGKAEWLTFNEAKEIGFIGNEWTVAKVSNYKKEDFTNKQLLIPNLFNNQKSNIMQNEEEKKSLFSDFKNWLKNDAAAEAAAAEDEMLKGENEALKAENEALKAELEALKNPVANEPVANEDEPIIDNSIEDLKAEISNLAKAIAEPPKAPKVTNVVEPVWKQHLNHFQNIIK